MMSSVASLRELDIRSSSPSPFTPSGRRSPTSPTTPGFGNGSGSGSGSGLWGSPREGSEPQSSQSQLPGFHETVDLLKKGHMDAARVAVRAGPLRDELEDEIERDCESLRGFLQAAQVSLSAPPDGAG